LLRYGLGLRLRGVHDVCAAAYAAFLLGHPAPDAEVLPGFQRPRQALRRHGAAGADLLGLTCLFSGDFSRPDREEQFRVLVAARAAQTPIHRGHRAIPPLLALVRGLVTAPVDGV